MAMGWDSSLLPVALGVALFDLLVVTLSQETAGLLRFLECLLLQILQLSGIQVLPIAVVVARPATERLHSLLFCKVSPASELPSNQTPPNSFCTLNSVD